MILTFSCCSKNVREMLGRNNIQPSSCLRFTVLRKERLSSQRRQWGYNKLTFIGEIPRYLKGHVCEGSSRNQPANAGSQRKNLQKMPLSYFNRPYRRMRIQNALLFTGICFWFCPNTSSIWRCWPFHPRIAKLLSFRKDL